MGLFARRSPSTVPPQEAVPTDPGPPEPTILLTYEGWIVGNLVDTTGRVSDALTKDPSIALATDDGLRDIDRDEVLMVIPPGSASSGELRIAKRCVPVTVDLSETMSVSGLCHVMPGATVWDTWQRSASGFAPLTDAVIGFPDGTTESADVVLVSRHAAGAGLRPF